MYKSNELFTKLKKRIGSTKLQQILQELDDANKDKETETAVSFIEEISPPSSTSKEHGNSNSSRNNNNNPELYLDYYSQLFLNQAESPLPPPPQPPPPSASPPPRQYHHHNLPQLQPRREFPSLLNSPRTTITTTPATSTSIAPAATSPRVSSPIDLTFIAPTLSPLPPSAPPPPPPSSSPTPTPAPAAHKTTTTTTTTVSSSPRKNSHPKKISPPKPKKFGIGKNMNFYKRLCDDTSSDNNNDDESDEPSSTQPVKKYRVKVEYYKRNTSSGLYEIFKTKSLPYLCKTNENIIAYNEKQFEELNLIFEERKNYLNYLENKQEELIEKIKKKSQKK